MTRKGTQQTHCIRGHALDANNVYVSSNGNRTCKTCALVRSSNRYEKLDDTFKQKALLRQVIRHTGRVKYEEEYEAQNGLCAICGKENMDGRRLSSDHDHACCSGMTSCGECTRSFLCRTCNQGIGFLMDSPELLRKAATYIEHWRRKHNDARTTSGDAG